MGYNVVMIKKVRIFLLNVSILALTSCNSVVSRPVEQSNVQDNDIKIFFTPGVECENNIIERINLSKKIDIAVYSITNPNITNAIIAAYNRGTDIRIITDRVQAKGKKSLIETIKKAGIPVLTNKKHKIEHNKFAVFDDVHIVSGSYNWTTNASMYNSENCIFFNQPNKEYSHRFEQLWNIYKN
jgi:phosphatidylserine/phosphatidylglycerophosphate/cardiolipin synthase-like enzyme